MGAGHAEGRRCSRCGLPFTPARGATAGRFCSSGCAYAARRRYERPASVVCAQCGTSAPVTANGGRGRLPKYCGSTCYWEAMRRGRVRPDRPPCRQCGERPASKNGPFCSHACASSSFRRRVTVVCTRCGQAMETTPGILRQGGGKYCSRACATPPRTARPCEGCQRVMQLRPSERRRRYCSRACRFGPGSGMCVVSCRVCGTARRVSAGQLRRGHGTYCSRACFASANTRPKTERRCARCQAVMLLRPSDLTRRYCSRRCVALSLRQPRRVRCRLCGKEARIPAWQRWTYCSRACSNRGRQRVRAPESERRNRRILELHAQGLVAPLIRAALLAEDPAWAITPAGVRTVVHRAG